MANDDILRQAGTAVYIARGGYLLPNKTINLMTLNLIQAQIRCGGDSVELWEKM